MEIRSENTAIVNGVAKSIIQNYKDMKNPILDYGAGKLRNSKFLVQEGKEVDVLDTLLQVSRWHPNDKSLFGKIYINNLDGTKKYKTILSTFVLNVVPTAVERIHILNQSYENLEEGGVFICEVRRESGILKNTHLEPYNDGFLVGKGNIRTFQKPFSEEEIEALVGSYFKVIQTRVLSDSIVVIGVK